MKEGINIVVANPAGNITIFVKDKFERHQYQEVAAKLLAHKEFNAEQVAFIVDENRMEMSGLEFCGNASRTFALLIAKEKNLKGYRNIDVSVSGADEILSVSVDADKNYTRIKMPLPLSLSKLTSADTPINKPGIAVDFSGILHLVFKDIEPTIENFEKLKEFVYSYSNPPALGVMFYNTSDNTLTPVVYVKDVNTTYFEGSCASGTTAVAVAFADDEEDGTLSYALPQPAGTVTATVEKRNGKVQALYIEGPVEIGEVKNIIL